MNTYVSVDLGTTTVKVALVREDGGVVAAESREYPIRSPEAGFAEQDAQAWWESFVACCSALRDEHDAILKTVAGVGICGQMHTQVYLDRGRQILRPAITWMDQRSSALVGEINGDPETSRTVFAATRNAAATTYTAPQMRWVQRHQPEIWSRTAHVLVAKDYLKYRLTDAMATDYSEASGTLLFDVSKLRWSPEMFRLFDVAPSLMPEAGPSDEIIGKVSREAAALTGIPEGTPVANGCADNSAAALGAGMTSPGQVTLIIGTAGVISVCSDSPLADPENRTVCWNYCLRGRWINLGVTQTAGESLNWFRGAFDAEQGSGPAPDVFSQYNNAIRDIPDGSGGLIFLPYLNGERTPYWDADARGVFFGVNLSTTKPHFIKAVMEGVSFALRNCVETAESLGVKIEQIQAVGGGLKSDIWLATLGKIMKIPLRTVARPDTTLVGTMLLCARALGAIGSIDEAVKKIVRYDRQIHHPAPTPVYEKQYALFLSLYQRLAPAFKELAAAGLPGESA